MRVTILFIEKFLDNVRSRQELGLGTGPNPKSEYCPNRQLNRTFIYGTNSVLVFGPKLNYDRIEGFFILHY